MTTATPTAPSKPELSRATDGLPIYTAATQIEREHGPDFAIQMPAPFGYATLLVACSDVTPLRVWKLHADYVRQGPIHVGYIPYAKCRPHIDNEFSPGCLMRSHNPGCEFDDRDAYAYNEPEALFLLSRVHPRYGMNPDRMGLPLPEGVTPEHLTVGTRVLLRFTDRRDREGIITRVAPPGNIGDAALPMRAMVDNSSDEDAYPVFSEVTADYRQVVKVLGKIKLPIL